MRYTTLDTIAVAIVAVVAGVQYLRGKDNFSQVTYETLAFIGAAFGAHKLHLVVHELAKISLAVSFLVCFVVLAAIGVLIAAFVNSRASFDFGAFNYLLALFIAITSAYTFGHVAMRTFELGFVNGNRELMQAMERSWVARELVYFRTAKEMLVFMRFVRWKDQ